MHTIVNYNLLYYKSIMCIAHYVKKNMPIQRALLQVLWEISGIFHEIFHEKNSPGNNAEAVLITSIPFTSVPFILLQDSVQYLQ